MKGQSLRFARLWLLSVLLGFLGLSNTRPEAQKHHPAPILIGRCLGDCLYDTLSQEYAFALADAVGRDKIAIRLCTAERFEVAIAKTSGNLIAIEDELKRHHQVDLNDVTLLLSKSCSSGDQKRMATEFWVAPSHKSLPPYDKKISYNSVSITTISEPTDSSKVGKFVEQLEREPTAYGVVIGYFFRRPSPKLRRKVYEVEQAMKKRADLKGRFKTDLIPFGITYTGYVEPQEPIFIVIRISAGKRNEFHLR